MISEIINTILENYFFELTNKVLRNCVDVLRQKRLIKELKNNITHYCIKNESKYMDSSAFEYYICHYKFPEKVIERALSTRIDNSEEDFIKEEIQKARDTANAENVFFSINEEQIIKDLYNIINTKVSDYYRNRLSAEQRHGVSLCLQSITDLKSSIESIRSQNSDNTNAILNAINDTKLSNSKAEIIADLLTSELYGGRFKAFDDLASAVIDKSYDLSVYYSCLSSILRSDECNDAVMKIKNIENPTIRDTVIRTALPLLLIRKESLVALYDVPFAGSLREIVNSLSKQNYSQIIAEEITSEDGTEIHTYKLNKKYACEEKSVASLISIIFLYDKKIRNIYQAMEQLEASKQTWLTSLLIADKKVDEYLVNSRGRIDSQSKIEEIIDMLQKNKHIYDGLCRAIRKMYYSIIAKANLFLNRIDEAEKSIPNDLKSERPLLDYVYSIRIEKNDIELDELYDYVQQTDAYWLLNNYFIDQGDQVALISFCQKHNELFSEDWPLFFMYLSALKSQGLVENIKTELEKHSQELEYVYDYWNVLIDIDNSSEVKNAFIEACRNGQMTSLSIHSEPHIIERLLSFSSFDVAEKYLRKLEKNGVTDYRSFKYKAIISQSRKNDVEALKWYKASFNDYPRDLYVIDSIITLSLINKRTVDSDVIEAAIKADTSRLNMLVAAYYISVGKLSEAKNANIRSIMMSKDEYNPAFNQYIAIYTSLINTDNKVPSIVGEDTAALCKKPDGTSRWICIYKNKVLPSSPHIWNDDYHVHIDDAAGFGFLRKHKGDHVVIDGEDYEVFDIITIDQYFFRICTAKMTQNGTAKEIKVPSKDGTLDIEAFNAWMVKNTPDGQTAVAWIEQYNNIQDVPMPLYIYKGFSRCTYFQFVDSILSTNDIFVREIIVTSSKTEKYVISFSALVALFRIGFPVDRIVEAGGVIMESTLLQVDSDVSEIIQEYNRDTVVTMGVLDGKVFVNQVDDAGKDYILKNAGSFKQYCQSIPTVSSENDLTGSLADGVDYKTIIGICDYDAISFVQHNTNYSLVSIEAFLNSLASNEKNQLRVTSISDWFIIQHLDAEELIDYIKRLMNAGCLMSITKPVIYYLSEFADSANETSKNKIYLLWDDLLTNANHYSKTQKTIIVQAISEVFASFEEDKIIDRGILRILMRHMLILRNLKVVVNINEDGTLSFKLEDDRSDE